MHLALKNATDCTIETKLNCYLFAAIYDYTRAKLIVVYNIFSRKRGDTGRQESIAQ